MSKQRTWIAVSLILATVTVAGAAHAAARLIGPTGVKVTVQRDRIMGTTGKISAAGNKIRGDVTVQFSCPSSAILYVHAENRYTRKQWFHDFVKKPKKYTFKNMTLATTEDLQQACIDGKKRYDAKVRTTVQCKGTLRDKFHDKTITVPIGLTCKDVISPKHRTARISVKDWKHKCPAGFVFESSKKSTPIVSSSRAPRKCVRP